MTKCFEVAGIKLQTSEEQETLPTTRSQTRSVASQNFLLFKLTLTLFASRTIAVGSQPTRIALASERFIQATSVYASRCWSALAAVGSSPTILAAL